MSLDEYEAIRCIPRHFLVVAGQDHFFPDVERIFETHPGYWVVEVRPAGSRGHPA
jgi:hypothetical protein